MSDAARSLVPDTGRTAPASTRRLVDRTNRAPSSSRDREEQEKLLAVRQSFMEKQAAAQRALEGLKAETDRLQAEGMEAESKATAGNARRADLEARMVAVREEHAQQMGAMDDKLKQLAASVKLYHNRLFGRLDNMTRSTGKASIAEA